MNTPEIQAWYDIAQAMQLGFDDRGMPVYDDEGSIAYFRPLEFDASALRLQVHFKLSMEVTEYGVFIRVTGGRMLVWKEFPKGFDNAKEMQIIRCALFQAAEKLLAEGSLQAEILANS
jgi:hypothetical protein